MQWHAKLQDKQDRLRRQDEQDKGSQPQKSKKTIVLHLKE